MNFLAVGVGAAIGACGRFWLTQLMQKKWTGNFPLGTFLINVLGSFLIGWFLSFSLSDNLRLFLTTGMMGGFTTFSTFQSETLSLLQHKYYGTAIFYQILSLLTCLFSCFLGTLLP